MPDMNKILFIRAERCDDCTPAEYCDTCVQGFNATEHVLAQAGPLGWSTIDAAGDNAIKSYVDTVIDVDDPGVIYGFGHGNENRYTAQYRQDIFTTADCSRVNGRIVYLLSCLTGNLLGPAMMEAGALAYAGFIQSWTWVADTDQYNNFIHPDPYDDKFAFYFYSAANELMVALLNGYSFVESLQKSIDKYNEGIQYFYDNPQDGSSDCIMWLAYDRDALVAFSNCDNISSQDECIQQGCVYQQGQCATLAGSKRMAINPVLLIPVVFVVGIAFLVYKGKLR